MTTTPKSVIEQLLQTPEGALALSGFENQVRMKMLSEITECLASKQISTTKMTPVECADLTETQSEAITSIIEDIRSELVLHEVDCELGKQTKRFIIDDSLKQSFDGAADAVKIIMHAVSQLEQLLEAHTQSSDRALSEVELESLTENIQTITMACAFQDTSGQRINKVIDKVRKIDTALETVLNKISNPDLNLSVSDVGSAEESSLEEQERMGLLDGPTNNGMSQEEIDALINGA